MKTYWEVVRARFMKAMAIHDYKALDCIRQVQQSPKCLKTSPLPVGSRLHLFTCSAKFEYPSSFKNSKLMPCEHPLKLYLNTSSLLNILNNSLPSRQEDMGFISWVHCCISSTKMMENSLYPTRVCQMNECKLIWIALRLIDDSWQKALCLSLLDVVTKYHTLGGLLTRGGLFLTFWSWKSGTRMPAWSIECPLPVPSGRQGCRSPVDLFPKSSDVIHGGPYSRLPHSQRPIF